MASAICNILCTMLAIFYNNGAKVLLGYPSVQKWSQILLCFCHLKTDYGQLIAKNPD